MHILFVEDGEMDKRVFLATWKDIPSQNEQQFTLSPKNLTAGKLIISTNLLSSYDLLLCLLFLPILQELHYAMNKYLSKSAFFYPSVNFTF